MNIGPIATLPSPSLSTAELRQYNESNCRITILVGWGSQIIRWTWGGETFVISAQSSLWFTSPRPEQLLPQIIRHTAQMQTGWRKYLKPRVLLLFPPMVLIRTHCDWLCVHWRSSIVWLNPFGLHLMEMAIFPDRYHHFVCWKSNRIVLHSPFRV